MRYRPDINVFGAAPLEKNRAMEQKIKSIAYERLSCRSVLKH
jgi:hypothetical protein